MEVGSEQGKTEETRGLRLSPHRYKLENGRREFGVRLSSPRLGLCGVVDMVIRLDEQQPPQGLPVNFKVSHAVSEHLKLQSSAYGMLLEEVAGLQSPHGFIYKIPLRRAVEIPFFANRFLHEKRGVLRKIIPLYPSAPFCD